MARAICVIAEDIKKEWGPKVTYSAKPYLAAMTILKTVDDYFLLDPGYEIVARFLSNARQFQGEKAKQLKTELKALLENK